MTRPKRWPPPEFDLPDTIEAIEAGKAQADRQPMDDSHEARLRRILRHDAGHGPESDVRLHIS